MDITMDEMKCPVCGVAMEIEPEMGDWKCPDCRRCWYPTENAEAPWASRGRPVRLKKLPEEGDRLGDVIEPITGPGNEQDPRKAVASGVVDATARAFEACRLLVAADRDWRQWDGIKHGPAWGPTLTASIAAARDALIALGEQLEGTVA